MVETENVGGAPKNVPRSIGSVDRSVDWSTIQTIGTTKNAAASASRDERDGLRRRGAPCEQTGTRSHQWPT